MNSVTYIDEVEISHKRILVRVDYNVTQNPDHTIADDLRISQSIPTLKKLLEQKNKLILISHLGSPESRDEKYSLKTVAEKLQTYVPEYNVKLIDDFMTEPKETFTNQTEQNIFILENIRFYSEEKNRDSNFAKELAQLGEVYVNDAFGVAHRNDTSVTLLPTLLPHYGGLLMKKEIETISVAIQSPKKPFAAIIGGAKISTKIHLIDKLIEITDDVLIGGALANTFISSLGKQIGKSLYEANEIEHAKKLLEHARKHKTNLVLPIDVVLENEVIAAVNAIRENDVIIDIGPKTIEQFSNIILNSNTLIWNGPMGKFEDSKSQQGTKSIYDAIIANDHVVSIIGGGETITALSHESHKDKITHISTGGGAMLEFIEKGTLPGIEALKTT